MAGETTLTVVGNLVQDPELRYTTSGTAVSNFTVASTPRIYDRTTGEWKDGDTLFLRCTLWRQAAEHVTTSLTKGTRVIVTGHLNQRTYETGEGDKRTLTELVVDEVGPSLRYVNASLNRNRQNGPTAADEPPY
jgi:single-strand DNA-binding protein